MSVSDADARTHMSGPAGLGHARCSAPARCYAGSPSRGAAPGALAPDAGSSGYARRFVVAAVDRDNPLRVGLRRGGIPERRRGGAIVAGLACAAHAPTTVGDDTRVSASSVLTGDIPARPGLRVPCGSRRGRAEVATITPGMTRCPGGAAPSVSHGTNRGARWGGPRAPGAGSAGRGGGHALRPLPSLAGEPRPVLTGPEGVASGAATVFVSAGVPGPLLAVMRHYTRRGVSRSRVGPAVL